MSSWPGWLLDGATLSLIEVVMPTSHEGQSNSWLRRYRMRSLHGLQSISRDPCTRRGCRTFQPHSCNCPIVVECSRPDLNPELYASHCERLESCPCWQYIYVENQHNYDAAPPSPAIFSTKPQRSQTLRALQATLAFPEMSMRAANIAREYSQTCEWLFDTTEYKIWGDPVHRPVHHGILWIKGKPGAGKSITMKYAMRKVKEAADNVKAISFSFNARGQGFEKSTEGMYRCLLHQVIMDDGYFGDMVEPDAAAHYKKLGWPLELLKDLFREAVLRSGRKHHLACYIDALDECEEDDMREMLSLVEDIAAECTLTAVKVAICLASRHYPNVTIDHCEVLVLDNFEGHQDDISRYVRNKLKLKLSRHKQELAEDVRQRSSGIFLWVALVVAILNKHDDRGDVFSLWNRLRTIPTNLRQLFDEMIDREEQDENIVPTVQWVLYAGRPLVPTELYLAVMLFTGKLTATPEMWNRKALETETLQRFVVTSSKRLLRMILVTSKYGRQSASIEFIHESVREYFLNDGLARLGPDISADVEANSHEGLSRVCMSCIHLGQSWLAANNPKTGADDTFQLSLAHSKRECRSPSQLPIAMTVRGARALDTVGELSDICPFLTYVRDYGTFYHVEREEC